MQINKHLLACIGFLCLVGTLFSQNEEHFATKFINHKMRANLHEYLEFHLQHPELRNSWEEQSLKEDLPRISFRNEEEMQVNETPEAESELHAAINPIDTNNIIVGVMKGDPTNFLEPLAFSLYYTEDFGTSWQLSEFNGVLGSELLGGGGDPIIVFDSEGTAYFTWLALAINFEGFEINASIELRTAKSLDRGKTWEVIDIIDAGKINDILNLDFEKFVDKEWLAVDDAENSPYRDNIYAAYVEITTDETGEIPYYNMMLRTKKAAVDTFTNESVRIHQSDYAIAQFSSIDVDSDGNVHVTYFGTLDGRQLSIFHARSTDGGATFEPETKVGDLYFERFTDEESTYEVEGIDKERLYPCPHMIIDNSGGENDGNIYAVWTANGLQAQSTEALDIYYARSTDGGASWDTPIVLNDNLNPLVHQFYPSIDVNANGTLIVGWYGREDEVSVATNYYLTYSDDGGQTFEPSFPVTTSPSDFNAIGSANGNFGIGEYTQVISTKGYAIPFWSDGRSNDGNIDVYAAFISIGEGLVSGIGEVSNLTGALRVATIQPNPANQYALIQLTSEEDLNLQIELITYDGKVIKTFANHSILKGTSNLELGVSDVPTGTYLLQLTSDKGYLVKRLSVVH